MFYRTDSTKRLATYLTPLLLAAGFHLNSVFLPKNSQAQTPLASLNQRKINEIAAANLSAQLNLAKLTALKRPGETSEKYQRRLDQYFDFLEKAAAPLRSIVGPLKLINTQATNRMVWAKIQDSTRKLDHELVIARKWRISDARTDGTQRLGKSLMSALHTLTTIYRELRDAEP